MPVSYKTLSSERQWKATTGLSKQKFRVLTKSFKKTFISVYGMELSERQSNSSTEAHLKSYQAFLFFTLFSLKSGLTYDALGFVFGMSAGNALKVQREGIQLLGMALHGLKVMPKRVFEDVETFKASIPEEDIIKIDGTEQPVQRPVNQQDQKDSFSGKKKTHRQINRDK